MKVLYTLLMLIVPLLAEAQTASIKFEKFSHNFKIIPEKEGDVSCTFKYTNTGTVPLNLTEIRCDDESVHASWNKGFLPSGQSDSLTIFLDPRNKQGVYVQSIAVFANTHPNANTITIRGFVAPQGSGPFDDFPYRTGCLRFKENGVLLGSIPAGAIGEKSYNFINTGKKEITPAIENLPEHFSVKFSPSRLKPMEKGKMTVSWNIKNHVKSHTVDHTLRINDGNGTADSFPFRYSIIGNRHTTGRTSPIIELDKEELNIGKIACNEKINFKIIISNSGEEKLVISKIETPDGTRCCCRKDIKKSKSVRCKVRMTAAEQTGIYKGYLIFHTNDPQNKVLSFPIIYESVKK